MFLLHYFPLVYLFPMFLLYHYHHLTDLSTYHLRKYLCLLSHHLAFHLTMHLSLHHHPHLQKSDLTNLYLHLRHQKYPCVLSSSIIVIQIFYPYFKIISQNKYHVYNLSEKSINHTFQPFSCMHGSLHNDLSLSYMPFCGNKAALLFSIAM